MNLAASFMQPQALSDVVLLGKLVGRKNAKKLYNGSLHAVFTEGTDERCVAARELVLRWAREQLGDRDALTSPGAVTDYLRLHFREHQQEAFVVLFLDAQNRLIAAEEMFRGTLTQTSVYPREVVKRALELNAAAVILSHNHPSGVAEPSIQDQSLTRTLREALALVDVRVLDHVIAAAGTTMSFAERGLL